MSVRLNKVCRELNIGLQTIIEHLNSVGYVIDEPSPATKITDEEYAIIVEKFGKKSKKAKSRSRSHSRHEYKNKSNKLRYSNHRVALNYVLLGTIQVLISG